MFCCSLRVVYDSVFSIKTGKVIFVKNINGRMVEIPAAGKSFRMGQVGVAEPVHTVKFTYNYWIDTTEETDGAGFPIFGIHWHQTILHCNHQSKIAGFDTVYSYDTIVKHDHFDWYFFRGLNVDYNKNGYRLPTEAEWEYACRAGSTTLYFWGDSINEDYSWILSNSGSSKKNVAQKLPNNFGLYDMIGNVGEFCFDYHANYSSETQTDPVGPDQGNYRIIRGGSYRSKNHECYSATRNYCSENDRLWEVGFRFVRIIK
jgi:formylglycine-generating enzyme required for sulfatase activity